MSLHPRWREQRYAARWDIDIALVSASVHLEDMPSSPADLVEMFASLPPDARVSGGDDLGWINATWQEPSTETDRAELAARRAEEDEHAEFLAWRAARQQVT